LDQGDEPARPAGPEARGKREGADRQAQQEVALARALEWLCKAFALAGGAILAALTLMSAASIGGRLVNRPIQGDFELVQVGCAVAIAFFLPYCQLARGNIIVDFFTTGAPERVQRTLDAAGGALLALVMGLVAWRTGAGTLAMKAGGEVSMIMGLPLWIAYAAMTPAFALAAAAGLASAWRDWQAR
jgi:TRAP-type C4-dicarboxylate transport system permease small subunit